MKLDDKLEKVNDKLDALLASIDKMRSMGAPTGHHAGKAAVGHAEAAHAVVGVLGHQQPRPVGREPQAVGAVQLAVPRAAAGRATSAGIALASIENMGRVTLVGIAIALVAKLLPLLGGNLWLFGRK
jgi:hypothetical protein